MVDELRRGVRLKKSNYPRAPLEFELTPYEILMEDIRTRYVVFKIKNNKPYYYNICYFKRKLTN